MFKCESVFLSFKHALHHSRHRMGAVFIFQLILSTGMLQKLDARKLVVIWLWLNALRNNRKLLTSSMVTVRVYISWYILYYFTPYANKTLMFLDTFWTLYFCGIWVVYIIQYALISKVFWLLLTDHQIESMTRKRWKNSLVEIGSKLKSTVVITVPWIVLEPPSCNSLQLLQLTKPWCIKVCNSL